MGFPGERGREDGLLRGEVLIQVVHDAGGGLAQEVGGVTYRVSQEVSTLLWGQVRHESCQGIALGLCGFSHHGGPGHQSQHVEGDFGAVAVGIGHPERLQDAVIMLGARGIAEGIVGVCDEQIVGVKTQESGMAEGIARAVGKKEVLLGKGELLGLAYRPHSVSKKPAPRESTSWLSPSMSYVSSAIRSVR